MFLVYFQTVHGLTEYREKARLKNIFNFVEEVHRSDLQNVKRPPEPAHRFDVTLEPAGFTQEKFELFRDYQQHVHKEKSHEISQTGFKRFLCVSALQQDSREVDGKRQLLGSYHQCYRLDGRLIAMGVLDLLPHCVSGVYFLYHSDFQQWHFGKLSALREAALALEGGYQYYYMGYYIHTCTKMRYKGDYKPQHVLDPETYEWDPLDGELRELLEQKTYVSLSREHRRKTSSRTPSKRSTESADSQLEAQEHFDEDVIRDYPHPTAAEGGDAVSNGMSLFDLKVPGLMTPKEVETLVGSTSIRFGGRTAQAQVRSVDI